MAAMDEMASYLQNTELSPILDLVDERFEERVGRSRAEARQQEPTGGWWADAWLEDLRWVGAWKANHIEVVLQDFVDGIPYIEYDPGRITAAEWNERADRLKRLHGDVITAARNWQFVTARMQAGLLRETMAEMWTYVDAAVSVDEGWINLTDLI